LRQHLRSARRFAPAADVSGVSPGGVPFILLLEPLTNGSEAPVPYDCFISYNSADLPYAEMLNAHLLAAGLTVWFDRARLNPGCKWHDEIEEGCRNSRVVLPVLTARWKLSEWTRYETYGAPAVIPLLFGGVSIEEAFTPPLHRFQGQAIRLDAATSTHEEWASLANAVRRAADQGDAPPNAITDLPFPPNPYFVGRESVLNDIHEKLFLKPTTALTQGHIQAITALGGVGKTTLARQYAEKFWRCYPHRFWVTCLTPSSITAGFARIFDLLHADAPVAGMSEQDKAARALHELQQEGRPLTLLVLDDAPDEEAVLEWIPASGHCHTIITSRYSGWSPTVETTPVWVLDRDPARELLLSRSGTAWDPLSPQEQAACDDVASTLEYLPLALEQAAAYVRMQRCGFGGYLRLYRESGVNFLKRESPGGTKYPKSIYQTWRTTVERLPAGARAILRLAAFLSTTAIPVAILVEGGAIVAESAEPGGVGEPVTDGPPNETTVRDWIGALLTYSIVQPTTDGDFLVHALVQAVERDQLSEADRQGLLDRDGQLIAAYGPSPAFEPENWPIWDRLFPHAESVLEHLHGSLTTNSSLVVAKRADEYCFGKAYFERGLQYSELRLNSVKARYGNESEEYADDLINYGESLRELGRAEDAEKAFREALEIRRRRFPDDIADIATSLNYLGLALHDLGKYTEAVVCYREGLASVDRLVEPELDIQWKLLVNLAGHLRDSANSDDAEPLFRQALSISEKIHDYRHPNVASILNNLGLLLCNRNRYEEAESLYVRALAIREKALGPNHPKVAISLNNIADLLHTTGRYADAEPLFRRALAIEEQSFGANHPSVAVSLQNLAKLLEATGRYTDAEPLCVRALAINETALGPAHPRVATSLHILAHLLESTSRFEDAEPLYRRALAIWERNLGPEHRYSQIGMQSLARLLEKTGRAEEGHNLGRRRVAILAAQPNVTPLQLRTLGLDAYKLGDYATTTTLLRRVLYAGFEVPSTECLLARAALMQGDQRSFRVYADQAWNHRADASPYVVPRILWLQLTGALLEEEDAATVPALLGRLKTALSAEGAIMEWAMDPVLEHLRPQMSAESHALLATLVAAMSFPGGTAGLDQFGVWRDAPEGPLE
jgi:tetratricopeptide (TPR) repeat protein